MAGHWDDEVTTRRALTPRAKRVADELQARATELRENSEEGLSIREAVALAAVQMGMSPDSSDEARCDATFWDSVKKIPGGCWEWQGQRSGGGYGQFRVKGRKIAAHRYAYESRVGPIPPLLVLDHLCRNPSCVRPDHLEPVTIVGNTIRGNAPWVVARRGGEVVAVASALPPFSGDDATCGKCGHVGAETRYRKDGEARPSDVAAVPVDGRVERLERCCPRCRWTWDEALAAS